MSDNLVEQIMQLASDCVSLRDKNNGNPLLMGVHDGVSYCRWLTKEDLEFQSEEGIVACPYADPSVAVEETRQLVHAGNSGEIHFSQTCVTLHPGCKYNQINQNEPGK